MILIKKLKKLKKDIRQENKNITNKLVLHVFHQKNNKNAKKFHLISENKKYLCTFYFHANHIVFMRTIAFNVHLENTIKY